MGNDLSQSDLLQIVYCYDKHHTKEEYWIRARCVCGERLSVRIENRVIVEDNKSCHCEIDVFLCICGNLIIQPSKAVGWYSCTCGCRYTKEGVKV